MHTCVPILPPSPYNPIPQNKQTSPKQPASITTKNRNKSEVPAVPRGASYCAAQRQTSSCPPRPVPRPPLPVPCAGLQKLAEPVRGLRSRRIWRICRSIASVPGTETGGHCRRDGTQKRLGQLPARHTAPTSRQRMSSIGRPSAHGMRSALARGTLGQPATVTLARRAGAAPSAAARPDAVSAPQSVTVSASTQRMRRTAAASTASSTRRPAV
eukprot:360038-Chlamydomonas_euryale.AAC.4